MYDEIFLHSRRAVVGAVGKKKIVYYYYFFLRIQHLAQLVDAGWLHVESGKNWKYVGSYLDQPIVK